MDDPWKNAPSDLDKRVQQCVQRAGKLKIPEDRLVKYARMLIAAEEVLAHRAWMEQSTRDTVALVAAAEHGIYENDPKKARAAYAAARQAQREVFNSATALANRLVRFEELLKLRHRSLQVDAASKFPLADVLAASNVIRSFAAATTPHPNNLAEVTLAKSELSLTKAGHAFLWWRTCIEPYGGKWDHMYALARQWHLTDARDLETFRRLVRKSKPIRVQGGTFILGCPPWALS